MAVPYTFAGATSSIPLSQLDSNFATTITLGNTAIQLGNTVSTLNNMTLANVTISSVSTPITAAQGGTGLVTITSNAVMLGNGTGSITTVSPGTNGNVLTSNGTTWTSAAAPAGAAATPTALGTVYGLTQDTSGNANTVLGYQSLNANTTGSSNIAMGVRALYSNTSGARITALGYNALYNSTTSSDNTAVGNLALLSNTTGNYNTAIGSNALRLNTTASYNTAVGYEAGYSNTTGLITAVGAQALNSNTTGAYNVAVGGYTVGSNYAALTFNTTGSNNTAVGIGALQANTTASDNTALGYQALYASTGAQNTGIGANALDSVTTGTNNVGVGYLAGAAITTGSTNIAVGKENLQSLTTGSYNTHIGYATTAGAAGRANAIVICSGPNGATDKGDDTGFINANGGGNYAGNNSSSWSTTSDFRLKKNIVDNDEGIDKIMGIRVRNFEYRLPEEVDPALKPSDAIKRPGVQLGVIAQELQQVCPDCVKEESTGVLSVDSDNVFWHMVNAIKQLNAKVEALQAEITTLKGA